MITTVLALKGGAGKTTTAAFLAAARHQAGYRVGAIDGDDQGSLISWAERATWPWLTMAMPTKTIHQQIPRLLGGSVDDIIIDTPPTGGRLIQKSAIRAAVDAGASGTIIVPVQPTLMDFDQFDETIRLIEETAGLDEVRVKVLLTRVTSGSKARKQIREAIEGKGVEVFTAEIRQLQAIALAHGQEISDLSDYAAVDAEMQELMTK